MLLQRVGRLWTLRPMAEQQLISCSQQDKCAYAILWKQWSNPKLRIYTVLLLTPQ